MNFRILAAATWPFFLPSQPRQPNASIAPCIPTGTILTAVH